MCKKLDFDLMWKYVCNGEINNVKRYYSQGWEVNKRYTAFGKNHSLIAGAYRNKQHGMVDYLMNIGETITDEERTEIFSFCPHTAATKDFNILVKKLTLEQICIIENVIGMYKNDELFVANNDYEFSVDYANRQDETFPYTSIILWYEGVTETEDLIEFMNDICL